MANNDLGALVEDTDVSENTTNEKVESGESSSFAVSDFKAALSEVLDKSLEANPDDWAKTVRDLFTEEVSGSEEMFDSIESDSGNFVTAFLETMKELFSPEAIFEAKIHSLENKIEAAETFVNACIDFGKGVFEAIADIFGPEKACEIAETVEVRVNGSGVDAATADAITNSLDGILSTTVADTDHVDSSPIDLGGNVYLGAEGAVDAVTGESISRDFANEDAVNAFVASTNAATDTFLSDIDYTHNDVESDVDMVDYDKNNVENDDIDDTDNVDGGVTGAEEKFVAPAGGDVTIAESDMTEVFADPSAVDNPNDDLADLVVNDLNEDLEQESSDIDNEMVD